MVVSSSDDEGEHSDAGPLDSPPQRVEATTDGAGGAQDRPSEALEMVLSREAPRRRALPRRKWVFIGRYETPPPFSIVFLLLGVLTLSSLVIT